MPSMFWIYFVPMLANTVGILPAESDVYGTLTRWVLPGALVALLLSADIRGILKLGPTALGVMAASVGGIMIGAPVVMLIYRHWLPADAWQAVGALSGSWIGGSANMVAVKEGIGTPDDVFKLLIIIPWKGSACSGSHWRCERRTVLFFISISTSSGSLWWR